MDNLQRYQSSEEVRLTSVNTSSPSTDHDYDQTEKDIDARHLRGWPLFLIVVSLCLAVLLISLDRTIITTAIPRITKQFHSTEDIGWYGSAYLLTACAFQPLFGRIYGLLSTKWSYTLSMFFFEVGSLMCAVAPSSVVVIIGRSVAGFGSAGILTGSFVIVAKILPLQKRPIYMAIVGMMFGVGATLGPLIGGVFTDLATWRWCFYINLPAGGAAIALFYFCFNTNAKAMVVDAKLSTIDKIKGLDFLGNILLLGATTMLFLALEEGTAGKSWQSAQIIGLFCGFGAVSVIFVLWLYVKGDDALVPLSIVCQRTVAASCIMSFMIYGALLVQTYFLPIWFQAILGRTALQSGVDMIPFFVINAIFSIIAGILVSVVGYFVPPCIVGNAVATIGSGLLVLLSPGSNTAAWAGYECLVAVGFGLSIQQGFTAVQTVLPESDVPIGTAAVVACQSLGGAIFVSVGNSIFQSHFIDAASHQNIPGVNIRDILTAGATAFRQTVPQNSLPALLSIYNEALRQVFYSGIALAGVAFIASFFLEWKSVKRLPSQA